MFEPRISVSALAGLCRRMGMSLAAGIDIRKVATREGESRRSPLVASKLRTLNDYLGRGDSLSAALQHTGSYFPPLFVELVEVGEQTGKLPEVLLNLADHYEHQLEVRRTFARAIFLPVLELFGALFIIGMLILVMGFLPTSATGQQVDILGFGLTGVSGLLVYLAILAVFFGGIIFVVWSMRRGALWTQPVQSFLFRVPGFGRFLELLALSRLAWTLNLTLNTSLALSKALPLCLRSTRNARYEQHIDSITSIASRGKPLTEAFEQAHVFPAEFIDTMDVGERSGRLPESMGHMAEQYRREAQRRMFLMATAGGFAVFGLVMIFIVSMIFLIASRTFFPYIDTLNELSDPRNIGR